MSTLRALIREVFIAGYDTPRSRFSIDHEFQKFLEGHRVGKLLDIATISSKQIRCGFHGDVAPIAACKQCLDILSNANPDAFKGITRAAALPPPKVGEVPIILPGAVAAAAKKCPRCDGYGTVWLHGASYPCISCNNKPISGKADAP